MDELISTAEAGRRLGIKPQTVRAMLKDGRLRGTRVGNRLRVQAAAVEEYVERHRTRSIERTAETKRRDAVPGLVRAILGEIRGLRQDLAGEREA